MMQPSIGTKPRVKRFPTIPNLEEWLSHSVTAPMASASEDYALDEAGGSLGDSAYDFLDDRSTATTDDEGSANMTMSFSSSDRPESETPIVQRFQDSALRDGPDDDGENTAEDNQGSHMLQDGDWGIKFQEPLNISNNITRCFEVSHTLRELEDRELGNMLLDASEKRCPVQYSLAVKQMMDSYTLVPDKPFRVLFLGDARAKDAIMQKLGSALAASSEGPTHGQARTTSRFSVVPISSFGESLSRSPEVMLVDSVGLEMSVQDCISATSARKADGNDSIRLSLPDGTSVISTWLSSDSRFVISGAPKDWKLPDLAVFYLSDLDSMAMKSTQRFARFFMSRHRVPCLLIAQSQLPNDRAEAVVLDYMTPHLCFESSMSNSERPKVIKRLPVDLSTFLELDSHQLSQNLSCLVRNRQAERLPGQKCGSGKCESGSAIDPANEQQQDKKGPLLAAWSALKRDVFLRPAEQRALILGVTLLLILLPGFLPSLLTSYSKQHTSGSSSFYGLRRDHVVSVAGVPHPRGGATTTNDSTKLRVASTLATTSSTSVPAQTCLANAQPTVNPNTDLASLLLDSHALTPNNSAKFKVHVVGDCHIVLRPPHWFMRYRKTPKLYFNIMRQKEPVKHELLTLFDGVYALKIPRHEAYGTVNVTVRTTSKPRINETFQIELGNSWLKAAGWKKAAHTVRKTLRGDLDQVQNGLSTLYSHTRSELQMFAHESLGKVDSVRRDMERIRSASVNHTLRTTDLIIAHTKDLSHILFGSLTNTTSTLSKQLTLYNQHIRKDLALYVEHEKAAMREGINSISRSFAWTKTTSPLRIAYLRRAQKIALKAWWRFAGMPKHEPAQLVENDAASNSRVPSKRKQKGIR